MSLSGSSKHNTGGSDSGDCSVCDHGVFNHIVSTMAIGVVVIHVIGTLTVGDDTFLHSTR